MSREELMELIHAYLDGKLPEKERKNFESRLKDDAELRELLRTESILRKGVEYSVLQSMQSELEALESRLPEIEAPKATNRRIPLIRWVGVAATIVLVAMAGWLLVKNTGEPTPEELFALYFEPYPNLFYQEQRSGNRVNEKIEAFRYYDAGDYEKAVEELEQLLEKEYDPAVQFYLGVASLAHDDVTKSIEILEDFLGDNEDMIEEGKWYLALAYLKKGNVKEAKGLLKELTRTPSGFNKDAEALLNKF